MSETNMGAGRVTSTTDARHGSLQTNCTTSALAPQVVPGDLQDEAGRFVATLRADGILYKKTHSSWQMLRKPLSWALDVSLFSEAIGRGCTGICIVDLDNERRLYFASVETFQRFSFRVQRGGFAPQWALTLPHWCDAIGGEDPTQVQVPAMPTPSITQLGLFGGGI